MRMLGRCLSVGKNLFPMETHLDMGYHFIYNVKASINNYQGANKVYVDTKPSKSGGLMTGNLDMNNNRIYNVAQPNGDNQPATKIWSENKFLDKSSGVMAGPLNTSNNKITHLASATQDGDATNKKYIDDNYLKLSGGHITGILYKDTQPTAYNNSLLNYEEMKLWLHEKGNPQVRARLNMSNNKIINLADPQLDKDAINKQYLEKSHIKPSHYNNELEYLMTNKLQ